MWTLTNQWDVQHTTEVHDGLFVGEPESFTVYFALAGEPIWATTHISTLRVHDDDDDWAAIYFTGYRELDGRGVRDVNVHEPNNKFKKKVEIGSERMISLSYEADSIDIGARGVVSIQFWQKS
jgi:hypothetical protein